MSAASSFGLRRPYIDPIPSPLSGDRNGYSSNLSLATSIYDRRKMAPPSEARAGEQQRPCFDLRRRRWRAINLSILLLAIGLSGSCSKAPEPAKKDGSRRVSTVSVHFSPASTQRTLVGVVRARVESVLAFRVDGKIGRRLVDRGVRVMTGQPLAVLDQVDWDLQLQRAEAALVSAKAARDQALAEQRRIISLRERGWSTNAELDKATLAADQSASAYQQALHLVTLAKNTVSYTTLTAEADGIVTAVSAEAGQVVGAGTPVITLARADTLEADVSVPEVLLGQIHGASAAVTLWSQPDRVYKARLRELTPAADPMTRTYSARFAIEGAGPEVQIGMTAVVTLRMAAPAAARLPLGAIIDDGKGPEVFVVDPKTRAVSRKSVAVTAYETQDVLVSAGVEDGEEIVALGVHKLREGESVRIVGVAD